MPRVSRSLTARTFRTPLFSALAAGAALLTACSGGHRGGASADPAATPAGEAPAAAHSGPLTVSGSDTMVILAQRFAEAYMRAHPGSTIQVSGGGSGTGIAALVNGTTTIADASRGMKDDEKARVLAQRHAPAHETRVALDALAVYVHTSNQVPPLTLEQLAGIYRGQITNWKDVGGADLPIVLYSRENNSGTYVYFKEHVLRDADFATTAQTLPGTAAVINAVSRDPGGIGYGGIAYARGIRAVPLVGTAGTPVAPTMETATSGAYPLSRFLFMYTAGEPEGAAKDFLDWVVSPAGQALVEPVGFYPVPPGGA
jgi:phosphate transport system substrate-binding protein